MRASACSFLNTARQAVKPEPTPRVEPAVALPAGSVAARRLARDAREIGSLSRRELLGGRSDPQANALTARATMRPKSASATVDCTSIVYFARWVSGITSVGLKAVAFVKPRCR